MKPTYLVRPTDFHIFELDDSNGCYRSYVNSDVKRSDGTRTNAQNHFTVDNLTRIYGFFPIDELDIPAYEKKNDEYHSFVKWQNRPDGHGGVKGGTYEEYIRKNK